jgi:hypothetical protein
MLADERETAMSSIHTKLIRLVAMVLLAFATSIASAQQRLQRAGVVLCWSLVPAAMVSQKHALEQMHGVVPKDDGQNHHLVVAGILGQVMTLKATRLTARVI